MFALVPVPLYFLESYKGGVTHKQNHIGKTSFLFHDLDLISHGFVFQTHLSTSDKKQKIAAFTGSNAILCDTE